MLAAGFGLSGAALAIIDSNPQLKGLNHVHVLLPFGLAAAGAVAHGSISGYMNIAQPGASSSRLKFLLLSLLFAGAMAILILAVTGLASPATVRLHVDHQSMTALLIYSTLLPCAHLSWLTAAQDRRVPGLTSAFLVPVLSTTLLALTVSGQPGRKLFAALTLVVCGIAFSAARERGVPVVFAVALAALGSIEVSQALTDITGHNADAAGSFFSQLLVGLVAIFDGFVLSNAIARYTRLREACAAFYERAAELAPSRPDVVADELEEFESTILASGRLGRSHSLAGEKAEAARDSPLRPQWSQVELTLADSVSRYEWLVLVLGGTGVIVSLYAFAFGSTSLVTLALRAFSTAVVIGIMFAIQDYDRNRPEQILEVLLVLRRRFGFEISDDTAFGRERTDRKAQGQLSALLGAGLGLLTVAAIVSIIINVR